MRIGELAENAGVSVETVRYYQRQGLVGTPERPFGGHRHYTVSHLNRLRFIKRAQALGFSLADISSLLSLSASECAEVKNVANLKLQLVREKLTALAKIESVLVDAIADCEKREPYEGCPIIGSLIGQTP